MRSFIFICLLVISVNSQSWEEWKQEHNKQYSDPIAEQHAYQNFLHTIERINTHNAKSSYQHGLNQFSDLTPHEFINQQTCISNGEIPHYLCSKMVDDDSFPKQKTLPDEIDWRQSGAVTPVKNQLNCGSCWAFSTICPIESRWKIKTGRLYDLSEQQLVDCCLPEGSHGCSGGIMDHGYNHTMRHGSILSRDYAYRGKDGYCMEKLYKPVVNISHCVSVYVGNYTEKFMQYVVADGPISVAVNGDYFQDYKAGIINDSLCSTYVNHGVSLIGYGTENNIDYWIVKNSWGAKWGESGYVRIIRNKNMCGIAKYPSYPEFN